MKIDDLKNSFDAISPTDEQKDKMLTEILNAEEVIATKSFDFRRLFVTVAGIAAVIAISMVAFNYGDFNLTEEANMIAHNTDETVQKKTIKEEADIKKTEKTENIVKSNKNVQVAAAKPVTERNSEIVAEDTPVPMSMARTVEPPENINDETNENSGIAVASETEDHNPGIAVVSEEKANGDLEWMTIPALEEAEKLEEENVKDEKDKEDSGIEENEEDPQEVTE